MKLASLGLGAVALVACSGSTTTGSSPSGSSAAGALSACSPLAANVKPITLGNILGAGRHADGTVYVLDDGDPTYRAFISQGNILQRKEVNGSGSTGGVTGDASITATVTDTPPFVLQVERVNGATTKMGVYRGALTDKKSFEVGKEGDVLTLVGSDVVASFELRNLPGDIVAEYDATIADGHRVFVTRPNLDWHYEDFRVFYGTADRMEERRLVSASRGSTTFITFELDGLEQTAVFPSKFSMPSDRARLMSTPTASQPITVLTPVSPGADLTFFCR